VKPRHPAVRTGIETGREVELLCGRDTAGHRHDKHAIAATIVDACLPRVTETPPGTSSVPQAL
jgi:hypothetical protein